MGASLTLLSLTMLDSRRKERQDGCFTDPTVADDADSRTREGIRGFSSEQGISSEAEIIKDTGLVSRSFP